MNFGIHPFILITAVSALLAVVSLVVACKARSGTAKALMLSLTVLFVLPPGYLILALNPEIVDGRFRTYKAFYRDIQVGMSEEEVLALRDRRYPAGGKRQRPKILHDEPDRLGFFMNPESSREPNCEGIFLQMENGRVASKTYSPD